MQNQKKPAYSAFSSIFLALGWFSNGAMHRSEQIEAAVACAFVPRLAQAKLGMRY